jgi:hypothetical protein
MAQKNFAFRLCLCTDDFALFILLAGLHAMLCETCHSNEATVHLTRQVAGQPDEQRHLCSRCFPAEGCAANQARALFSQFGVDLPPDIEIRDETGAS